MWVYKYYKQRFILGENIDFATMLSQGHVSRQGKAGYKADTL